MATRPLITIGLPAFNSETTLAQAMASLIRQSFEDWELLIIDDGSSDHTLEVARSFDDARIRIVADGVHRGLPAQLNRAVQMARGKYFARMDADDLAYESRLERQAEFLDAHGEVDVVATWVTVFRSDGVLLGTRRAPMWHDQICAHPWRGIPMAHPTWMGPVQWFRANPYNEHMVRMEDRELLLRTYRHSRFAVIPEVLLAYREDSISLRRLFIARRNTCTMAINMGVTQRRVFMPAMVVAGQCARALMELVAVPTGLTYQILRNRALPANAEETLLWQELWGTVKSTPCREAALG